MYVFNFERSFECVANWITLWILIFMETFRLKLWNLPLRSMLNLCKDLGRNSELIHKRKANSVIELYTEYWFGDNCQHKFKGHVKCRFLIYIKFFIISIKDRIICGMLAQLFSRNLRMITNVRFSFLYKFSVWIYRIKLYEKCYFSETFSVSFTKSSK